jgi:hypothetical protein
MVDGPEGWPKRDDEATETKLDPGLVQFIEERQEIPKGEAAVTPVGEPRKRSRVYNLAEERRQERKERTREIVDPEGSSLLPAGRCPAVQKWHGVKGNSSGRFGSRKTVNRGRNWPSPKER